MKNDLQIQNEVQQALSWEPSVTQSRIGVTVENGIVTLTGQVPTFMEKVAAEHATQTVAGVKAVVEKLEVRLAFEHIEDDERIGAAAYEALQWTVQVPSSVKIKVEQGWITLSGEVEWEFQREAATRAVCGLRGVVGLFNTLVIHPHAVETKVKTEIEEALKRAATREARKIDVVVSGSRVTLTGKVRSLSEARDVQGTVWGARGVTDVVSRLDVAS